MNIKTYKAEGVLDHKGMISLMENEYDYLDLSEVEVEDLTRLLKEINAKAILLPDNVMRRHINAAKKNPNIKELRVNDTCPIFSFEDGKLMNKKKTKPVFGCQAYTVKGEIRGEWNTWHPTVDIILNDAEVEQIKKLVSESDTDDFLSILEGKMPKLYSFLDWHFYNLAWKQVVEDGMGYYNLSRREAENAEMTGDEYEVFIPEEFETVN